MTLFNVTAQVYNKSDSYKQTILVNKIITAESPEDAGVLFNNDFEQEYKVIKIFSIEKIKNMSIA